MTKWQRQYNGTKKVSSRNCAEIIGHLHAKRNLGIDFISFTKIKSKWIINLNVRYQSIKLLGDNIGENLDDF